MSQNSIIYNPPMGLDKKTDLHTVSIKREPVGKLEKISNELAQILEEEPENNEALTYWRYIDSELTRRGVKLYQNIKDK